jgi:hypothetical protein
MQYKMKLPTLARSASDVDSSTSLQAQLAAHYEL